MWRYDLERWDNDWSHLQHEQVELGMKLNHGIMLQRANNWGQGMRFMMGNGTSSITQPPGFSKVRMTHRIVLMLCLHKKLKRLLITLLSCRKRYITFLMTTNWLGLMLSVEINLQAYYYYYNRVYPVECLTALRSVATTTWSPHENGVASYSRIDGDNDRIQITQHCGQRITLVKSLWFVP